MIKEPQARNLMKQLQDGTPLYRAAALSDMDRKTAHKPATQDTEFVQETKYEYFYMNVSSQL